MSSDTETAWKPNGRPQSTVAKNFMSELDDLFKIDGGLEELDQKVHEKKQAVTTHAQELEALEARLRETEERLKQAKTSPSPPRRKDSQRRTPVEGTFADADKAREAGSPVARHNNAYPDRPLTTQRDGANQA